MSKQVRLRLPSPAMVIALIALAVALGGTGYAAIHLPANSVGSKQLKRNAVISRKIKKNAVTRSKIKNNSVTGAKVLDHSLTGADIDLGALGTVPSANHAATADVATNASALQGHPAGDFEPNIIKTFGPTNVPKDGSPVTLLSYGPFKVEANCVAGTAAARVVTAEAGSTIQTSDVPDIENSTAGQATPFGATGNDDWFDGFDALAPSGPAIEGKVIGVNAGDFNNDPNNCYELGHYTIVHA